MLNEELSTDMDRITQLQDAILDLLTITSTSIDYITKRTEFEQTSTKIPTTLQTPHAANRQEYKASIETFVQDIVRRSKDIKKLIESLPRRDDSSQRANRLSALQEELAQANEEYKDALAQSEELLLELQSALDQALGEDSPSVQIPTKLLSTTHIDIDDDQKQNQSQENQGEMAVEEDNTMVDP
ncbi:hypothetical protein I302_102237 [Kwoniella bestiolae CBS 10118]|uniref:Mediator of RNA polymerase II transcription subunit 21 n=1 Tax=Kwoniella bestiolae CBS 10118 TaxID=1296100 RepID=A0A1B9GEM8_9TREE|nr:hypothetical protein I302_00926 [Kwoniella bestiolae CBS 10118]OCF29421.1 hypothetical protein I302_00926 [Kwoniella bestiolae CBS 10118]